MWTFPVTYCKFLSYHNDSHLWSALCQGLKYYLPRVHRYIITHMPPPNAKVTDYYDYYADVEPTAIIPLADSRGVAAVSPLDTLAKPALFIESYLCGFLPADKLELLLTTFYHPQPAAKKHWSFKLKAREEDTREEEDSTRAALCAIVF